jgi:hypothetical protein
MPLAWPGDPKQNNKLCAASAEAHMLLGCMRVATC